MRHTTSEVFQRLPLTLLELLRNKKCRSICLNDPSYEDQPSMEGAKILNGNHHHGINGLQVNVLT